jgi:hypothetical protein
VHGGFGEDRLEVVLDCVLRQEHQAPRIKRDGPTSLIRVSPVRCLQPRDAAHMRGARNLGRFITDTEHMQAVVLGGEILLLC